jgi:orotate phosphoribosyltransferase
MGRQIEGILPAGEEVVVVEDVITSGESAQKAISVVEAAGGRVVGVLAVVDREQGGRGALEGRGRSVVCLTTASDLSLRQVT